MKRKKTETLRLEELLDKKIVTAGGKPIGHLFDIQLSRDGEHRVTALMYGQKRLLYRLHVYEPVATALPLKPQAKTITREAVHHVEPAAARLKAGYDERRSEPGRPDLL